MKKTMFIVILLFLLLPGSAWARLEIIREVLPNGLTLLVAEKHNLPLVMVNVCVQAGTLVEPPQKAGLANLTASLLPEGTESRTSIQVSEAIDFMGASLASSGDNDFVTVTLSILKKDIDQGFEILSDVLQNPAFVENEIQKHKKRIVGMIQVNQEDPGYVAGRAFEKALFGEAHPYGRPVLGNAESVQELNRQDVVAFYQRFYKPNRTIMAIVGDVTVEESQRLLDKYFSRWKAGELLSPPYPDQFEKKSQKKNRAIKIDRDLKQTTIILGHGGIARDNPDYYAVSVMNYILGSGGFSSRLMDTIRDDMGLVYSIYSAFSASKLAGDFTVNLQTANKNASLAVKEVLKQLEQLKDKGVTDQELADAKSYLTGSFPLRIETNATIASVLVAVEYYNLGMDYLDKYPDYINSVTKDDVKRVANKYIWPEKLRLVAVGNIKEAEINFP
jgi:zinc protease